jgi:hypothetical protein
MCVVKHLQIARNLASKLTWLSCLLGLTCRLMLSPSDTVLLAAEQQQHENCVDAHGLVDVKHVPDMPKRSFAPYWLCMLSSSTCIQVTQVKHWLHPAAAVQCTQPKLAHTSGNDAYALLCSRCRT